MINKFLVPLLMVIIVGCTNQPPQPPAAPTFTHTITIDTEYYTDGPQQARPPDGKMKVGTKVSLVEEAGSYCRVKSEDGVEGYIAAGSLEAARTKGRVGPVEKGHHHE